MVLRSMAVRFLEQSIRLAHDVQIGEMIHPPRIGILEPLISETCFLLSINGTCLILDVVINHLTSNQTNNTVDYSLFPSPFNTEAAYHRLC
jgi:hypothetical protein